MSTNRLKPKALPEPEALPESIAKALWDATRIGYVRGIKQQLVMLEQLGEPYTTFARRLQELNNSFELKQIAELIQPYLQVQQPPDQKS